MATVRWYILAILTRTKTTRSAPFKPASQWCRRSPPCPRKNRKLSARVGVATGVALVGDMSDSAISEEHGILGDTPNLAARLQSLAQPGGVIISGRTKTIAGPQFEYLDLGKVEIKGFVKPVAAWQVAGKTAVTSRSHALQSSDLLPLIGRDEEMELLLRRWERARSGEGQVVLLSGEAGIGKSRLTVALLEQLAREPHIRLRCFCSPQHTDSTLYPVIGEMLRAARFAHDDSQQVKTDKLDALLAQSSTPPQDAALFAEMLSLPNDGRYPPVEVEPQLRRQKTLKALGSQIEALARINPVLVIFEDAHWADPTSLELFARTVDLAVSHRLLILVTFRPEFSPPSIGRPHVTELTLHRLAPCDIDFLIEGVVGNRSLPAGIRQDIIERTDGIPLFAEEMTKAVLDAEGESDAQRACAGAPTPVVAVPASLQASLMSRLDRLGPAKDVAQVGAAIGRAFPHMLLAALVRKPKEELDSDLDRLIAAGLLFRHGTPPHANYLFKHALVQDVAYSTLLREPRRALHARIAEILESQFPEIAESQPELLARHYTKADLIEKSARLWGKAGQRSQERSALVEAAEQLGQALAQIATLPSTPDLRREQIILQVALLNTLMHVKGYGAPETKAAVAQVRALIEQAERLGETPDDPSLLLSALFGQWIVNFINFNGDVARELAARFLALGEKEGAAVPLMIGHRTMASTLALMGDLVEARAHYDEAARPLPPRRAPAIDDAIWPGPPGNVPGLSFNGLVAARLSRGCAQRCRLRADGGAPDRACCHFDVYAEFPDSCEYLLRELPRGKRASQRACRVGGGERRPVPKSGRGVTAGLYPDPHGEATKAVEIVTSGIDLWRSAGSTIFTPEQEFMLAIAHADSGQFDDAWRCIDEAMTAMQATKERWCEAEAHRVAGEIALKSPQRDVAKAQAYFEHSLTLARAQQAKSWELRAATSLARLLSDQGKRQTARDLLAPVYDWFTEGFDTSDLRKAKALLGELH